MSDVPSTFAEKVRKYYDLPKEERKQRREKLRKCLRSIVEEKDEEAPPDDFFDDVFEVLAKNDDPFSEEEDMPILPSQNAIDRGNREISRVDVLDPTRYLRLKKMNKNANLPMRNHCGYDILSYKNFDIPAHQTVFYNLGWIFGDSTPDTQFVLTNAKKSIIDSKLDYLEVRTKVIDSHSDPDDMFIQLENKSGKKIKVEKMQNIAYLMPHGFAERDILIPGFVDGDD